MLALTKFMPPLALILAALWGAARDEAPARAEAPGVARAAALARGHRPGEPNRGDHRDGLPGNLTPDDGEGPDDDGGPVPAPAVAPPRIGRPAPLPPPAAPHASIIPPGSPRFLTLLRVRC